MQTTNRKAAAIAGIDVRELGHDLVNIDTGHLWDIGSTNRDGDSSRERLLEALGEKFGIGLCCSSGRWFFWSEPDQDHLGTDDYPNRRDACIAIVHLIEVKP